MDQKPITANDVMTSKVIILKDTTTFKEAVETLLCEEISGAPVADKDGKLSGVITEEDLMAVLYEGLTGIADKAIKDIYSLGTSLVTRNVTCVKADAPLANIVKAMMIHRIKRLPVVDDSKQVIGVVSRRDILKAMTLTGPAQEE